MTPKLVRIRLPIKENDKRINGRRSYLAMESPIKVEIIEI